MKESRKRAPEGIRIRKGNKKIKVTNCDVDLWHSRAAKTVDSEHGTKRHKENGQ